MGTFEDILDQTASVDSEIQPPAYEGHDSLWKCFDFNKMGGKSRLRKKETEVTQYMHVDQNTNRSNKAKHKTMNVGQIDYYNSKAYKTYVRALLKLTAINSLNIKGRKWGRIY